MIKVRLIRLLTVVLAIGTLVSPSYSAQASTPLGNVFFSQTVGDGTNFLFSEITVTKTNYLAQSESVTVTGLLKTDPGGVQTPLASATVTISLQKVDPTNSNANVGAPISVTAITGTDGTFTKSFTSPTSGKYFITLATTNGSAAKAVKATAVGGGAFYIYSFDGGPGLSITVPSSLTFGAAADLDIALTLPGGGALANESATVLIYNTGHPSESSTSEWASDAAGLIQLVIPAPNYDTRTVTVTAHASNVEAGDFSLMIGSSSKEIKLKLILSVKGTKSNSNFDAFCEFITSPVAARIIASKSASPTHPVAVSLNITSFGPGELFTNPVEPTAGTSLLFDRRSG